MRASWARRALDLPSTWNASWRLSADNCLVFGTSVLGAHKYYLRTGAVRYRIHGNNGWWGRQTPATRYLNRFRSRCLIETYARSIGLTDHCLESVKHEFLTKPDPSWGQARHYARLVRLRRGSWLGNLGRAVSILWGRLARRSGVPRG